ncbi:nuclease, partial [Salmonella enterica subsp. enterica]|nr:nuclease [Salmonella enterica subsp. enterica]
DARQKRLGLWSDPLSSIVEPWIWRRVNNKFRAHETAK